MTARPLVIQTESLDPRCAEWLAERCDLVACAPEQEPGFGELLARAEGLVIRTYTQVDGSLLNRAPRLRVVGRAGVGLDNVDVGACRARGVTVVSTPDANTRAVVELVFAYMLDALRPRAYLGHALPLDQWKSHRAGQIAPRQLADLTIGILGLGRVGKGVARAAAAFNMRALYNDLLDIPPDQRCGAEPVGLDRLLADADIFTVHIDGRPDNRGFMNAQRLARLKPDALFINASRGLVLDAGALADLLRRRPGNLAVLDVHEPEPFGPDYPLLRLPNARLTAHIGAATATAHRNMSWVVRDVWRVLCGEPAEFAA